MKKIGKWFKTKFGKTITIVVLTVFVLWIAYIIFYPILFESYTGLTNAKLTYDSSVKLSDTEFNALAKELTYSTRYAEAKKVTADETNDFTRQLKTKMLMNTKSFTKSVDFPHIKYFRDAGIRQYKGPETCLKCHKTMKVQTPNGEIKEVNTMEDVVNSIHFKFFKMSSGFSTYGYNAKEVNAKGTRPIPVGKIDRACGIPGSFSWTGWAAMINTKPESKNGEIEVRSEGCGQCHIGGNYQPATEKMMPIGDVPVEAKNGIDCLICHSQTYDMDYRYVIKDKHGLRWNHDMTLSSAMTVTAPTSYNCLMCHQHDLGGDAYKHNYAAQHLGYKNKRIIHPGTKRGTAFAPEDDVHAKAGLQCTDCHVPEGHKIPRGNLGSDLVSNDLPGKSVSCENCHTSAPHTESKDRVILNGHVNRLACETCHITHLQKENVVLRDWVNPTWNEEEGMYVPTDILRSGETNIGFTFLWYNGTGTFLANAMGDNPLHNGLYKPFENQLVHYDKELVRKSLPVEFVKQLQEKGVDIEQYLENVTNTTVVLSPEMMKKRKKMIKNLQPLMDKGESKIYPFKLFNAYMYEDMSNQGPFGGMILPFDYPTYYETGNSIASVAQAVKTPIVKRMYELPFKEYMMDDFMHYFGVSEWHTVYPIDDNGNLRNVKPFWMRQMGTLMINHGITKEGRTCAECHTDKGILDFKALGYPPERVKELQNLPELKYLKKE
ncbi:MAG: nitrite reductase [Chlorobi bacterium]|nr:nitrite reductase [Chlorobiota bacterium]